MRQTALFDRSPLAALWGEEGSQGNQGSQEGNQQPETRQQPEPPAVVRLPDGECLQCGKAVPHGAIFCGSAHKKAWKSRMSAWSDRYQAERRKEDQQKETFF